MVVEVDEWCAAGDSDRAGSGARVAVVVVSHNSAVDILPCLESLSKAQSVASIVVVDNASSDDSVAVARQAGGDRFRILALTENTGFSGGCNRGFAAAPADAEVIAFMNPDVQVEAACFEHCLSAFAADANLACVAPLLLRPDRRTVDSAGQMLRQWSLEVDDRGYGKLLKNFSIECRDVLAACGALAVFRREALEEISEGPGPWAEHFFCFWEDLEIGWRLTNGGRRVRFDAAARAVHGRGAGASPGSGPLRWRRPPYLEACIVTNRWMTLIRHLHTLDLLSRGPLLLVRDLVLIGAGVVRRPSLARHVLGRLPLVMREMRWRRAHRRVRLRDISW
jgi:GT2 family glycosyltransferase